MTNFRKKLLDFKQRLSKGKMYSIAIVILAVLIGVNVYQYQRTNAFRQQLENQYNRAFFDMVGYVQNIDTLLIKSIISTTPEKTAQTLQEIWRQANLAQENLNLLPVSQPVLANTSKFLNQVSDLSYSLSNQNLRGRPISNDQYDTLEDLNSYAQNLKEHLFDLHAEIAFGRLEWGELADEGSQTFYQTSSELPSNHFENIDKTFKDYPTLIYDGPFSDHLTQTQPLGLTGEKITSNEARKKVGEFITQENIKDIEFLGKNENNLMENYVFSITLEEMSGDSSFNVAITKKGGHPLWMIYNRPTQKSTISIDEAKQSASNFLEKRGFNNMVESYFLKEDGFATINYAHSQDDVIMYPDLIKVKVALDNGEICGFESRGYLSAHHDREIPTPNISIEDARNKINPRMDIEKSRLAFIPTEYKTEVFVYEFIGSLNDQNFIVYINAQTGEEEEILILLETPNGTLTL